MQVRKSFHRYQGTSEKSGSEASCTLHDIPSSSFPLFLTQPELITMIDATLELPFFQRNSDGSVKFASEAGLKTEVNALEALPEDVDSSSEDEKDDVDEQEYIKYAGERDSDSDDELEDVKIQLHKANSCANQENNHTEKEKTLSGEASPRQNRQERRNQADEVREGVAEAKGKSHPRTRVDFKVFEGRIWPQIQRKLNTKNMSPSTVFQEIQSFMHLMCVMVRKLC
jgi:hypothetical protein